MKSAKQILLRGTFAGAVMMIAPSARAQVQTTGRLGSPSATTTIDGKQLPPPPMPFGGVIKESATDSKSYWPARIVPPKGAPNVLLIMTDDQGYGVLGYLWRRHPDSGHGPNREGGIAIYAVSLHRALLANAGGASHRPEPSLGRLRRYRRDVHRLSRL